MKHTTTLGLAFAIAIAAFGAACGSPPPPEVPGGETPPAATGETPPAATGEAPPAATGEAPPAATGEAPPAAAGAESTPVQASKYLEDVKKIGIDLTKAGPLEKLSLSQKKKLMPLFQKALGYDACTGCHVEGDFKKSTRNVQIARQMWDHFIVEMRDEKGGAIFCDSCHGGKAKVLNRADKKAVQKFMEENYEEKLSRADKKDNECSTCHGDDVEPKIIEKMWKISG